MLSTGGVEFEVKDGGDKELPEKKETFTAWGKEVGGLQAGLGVRAGERRAYHHGETVALVVRVRNVGTEAVKFQYLKQFLDEKPPAVTDADGKAVAQSGTRVLGIHVPVDVTLEPGKEIELESRMHGAAGLRYELSPAGGGGKNATKEWPLRVGTGTFRLQVRAGSRELVVGVYQARPGSEQARHGEAGNRSDERTTVGREKQPKDVNERAQPEAKRSTRPKR